MSPIKDLSNIRRLPKLGKIALGIKKISEKTGEEHPFETDYFVCPPKVQEVYGEKPKELKIMFPVENPEIFFQQFYKRYSYNLLKCKGDGERAMTWDEEIGGMKEIECPCEKLDEGKCKRIGILQFMLPDVPGAGVWQITTSSWNSIVDINSGIDYIKGIAGRIRLIPLILKRVPTTTQRIENGKPKIGKHFTLQIDLDNISIRQLQEAGQVEPEKILLPAPDESIDDLFFPSEGFKPEEKAEEEKPEEKEKPKKTEVVSENDFPIDSKKARLNFFVDKYREKDGQLSMIAMGKISKLLMTENPDEKKLDSAIQYMKEKLDELLGKSEEEPKLF